MLSFQRPDPYDVFVLPYMSGVEIVFKALVFTFSVIYKTTANYQSVVFPNIIFVVSEISQVKCKQLSHWFNRSLHSHFSFYHGTPIIANKSGMHSKTTRGHMQIFHT